jgi:hypothetical protein
MHSRDKSANKNKNIYELVSKSKDKSKDRSENNLSDLRYNKNSLANFADKSTKKKTENAYSIDRFEKN